jgi:galactose mutarotase-like enzyme
MLYTLENNRLTVTVNERGAELWSIRSRETGAEYLWQGDPAYWGDRSPIMFPFCGRVQENRYSHKGEDYSMGCHGFAAKEIFAVERSGEDALRFTLRSSEATRKVYPFDFVFHVTYRLEESRLSMSFRGENTGREELPFMVGAHPGFFVPLGEAPSRIGS